MANGRRFSPVLPFREGLLSEPINCELPDDLETELDVRCWAQFKCPAGTVLDVELEKESPGGAGALTLSCHLADGTRHGPFHSKSIDNEGRTMVVGSYDHGNMIESRTVRLKPIKIYTYPTPVIGR